MLLRKEIPLEPYDIAVVTGDHTVVVHKVYAGTEEEAVDSIRALYKETTIIGIILGAEG
jgi:hypothetical protein